MLYLALLLLKLSGPYVLSYIFSLALTFEVGKNIIVVSMSPR